MALDERLHPVSSVDSFGSELSRGVPLSSLLENLAFRGTLNRPAQCALPPRQAGTALGMCALRRFTCHSATDRPERPVTSALLPGPPPGVQEGARWPPGGEAPPCYFAFCLCRSHIIKLGQ